MKEYLSLIRDGREKIETSYGIDWSVLDIESIEVENHSKRAGLQLADVTTSAISCAVEPNFYGNYERQYADIIASKLIKKDGHILDYGLTPIPHLGKAVLTEAQRQYFIAHKKNEQTPGS
jgi:hypothetical protein